MCPFRASDAAILIVIVGFLLRVCSDSDYYCQQCHHKFFHNRFVCFVKLLLICKLNHLPKRNHFHNLVLVLLGLSSSFYTKKERKGNHISWKFCNFASKRYNRNETFYNDFFVYDVRDNCFCTK